MVKPFGRKDKKSSAFLFYHGHLVFKHFYYALDISSPKYFSKVGQDGGENISANQDGKAMALSYLCCPGFKLL